MNMHFRRSTDGSQLIATDEAGIDTALYIPVDAGGSGEGLRAMQLMIMSVGACATVDVLSILKKQRQEVAEYNIEIHADRDTSHLPSPWEKAHLVFTFAGGNVDLEKAQRAVELSMVKYCSATETLRLAGAKITWEVKIVAL